MDNITHTLIGLAIAETVSRPKESPQTKKYLYLASAIANNIPDADVFFTKFVAIGKLGYLLHHRGHTHTLLAAPLIGTILLFFYYLLWKEKDVPWKKIIGLTYFGCLFHIFSDYWNIYGVHPFWPFDNSWFYGDMLFIVEPIVWIITIPFLFFSVKSLRSKALLAIPLAGIFVLAALHSSISKQTLVLMLATLTLVSFYFHFVKSLVLRKALWVGGIALLLMGLFFTSQYVKSLFPDQTAASPLPANPLCWQIFQAKQNQDLYRIDIWQISLAPRLISALECGRLVKNSTSSIELVNEIPESNQKLHLGTFKGSIKEFLEIVKTCQGGEFMKFARLPFWTKSGDKIILGDIRFDRDQSIGFAEIIINDAQEPCPKISAPWVSTSILRSIN